MVIQAAAGSIYSTVDAVLQLITPANVSDPIEFWLSFMLILAILNTVLGSVEYFKEPQNKASRNIISLILSYFAVTVAWVNSLLGYISSTLAITMVILVAILMVAVLSGVEFKKNSKATTYLFIGAMAVLFFGGLFSYAPIPGSAVGSSSGSALGAAFSAAFNSGQFWTIIVFIGLFVLVAFTLGRIGGSGSSSS
jgi:hypothetical protein